tara:strand:- start:12220 stop:12717 length:498 start_codon:yes stop_codon:yes gene_type:complete
MAKVIHVRDSLQIYGYTLDQSVGKHFDPAFTPDLTPQQMLELGVFGGHYFQGEHDEFPASWFVNAKMSDTHDPSLNYFGVDASQSRQEWQRKGWIHEQDPRGWFQWYCRYYLGRRSDDDTRQMKRWKAMRRHVGQIKAACSPGDESCRPAQRQALLHWAYDSRTI